MASIDLLIRLRYKGCMSQYRVLDEIVTKWDLDRFTLWGRVCPTNHDQPHKEVAIIGGSVEKFVHYVVNVSEWHKSILAEKRAGVNTPAQEKW
jgi:hypothetical protein